MCDPTDELLVLGSMTLQHASFSERVQAAAAAGIHSIGYHYRHYRRDVACGARDRDLVAMAAHCGVDVVEVESVHGLLDPDPTGKTFAFFERQLAFGALFGARHIIAHSEFDGDLDRASSRFADCCARAAEDGIMVGLEFVPWTTLPDLCTTMEIVDAAGCANGGVIVDSWHFFWGGEPDFETLERLRPNALVDVQLTDGAPAGINPLQDTLTNRCLPGEGAFDLERFVRAVRTSGAAPPWSIEIICPQLDALPPVDATRRAAASCRRLLGSTART